MNFISRLAELDDLYLSVQKVSGFTVEQLLDMFMAGYEMSAPKYGGIPQLMPQNIEPKKKEAPTMKVTYNGFTGELVKLEKYEAQRAVRKGEKHLYELTIYDNEKQVAHCFMDVKLEDVKFLGGTVTFGG